MPQSMNQRVVNTFVKGLITEATELTFPEDASIDELNCDLSRKGNRRRRKALIKETNAKESTFSIDEDTNVTPFVWKNASQIAGLDFLVIKCSSCLRFYKLEGSSVSPNEASYSVNLSSFNVANRHTINDTPLQFTTLRGLLIVTGRSIDSIYVRYDEDSDSMVGEKIDFKVRDFEWRGDTTEYFEETTSPSKERQYDTYNSGWTEEVLNVYDENENVPEDEQVWPPLTHRWFSGKSASGNFSTDEFRKIYAGNTLVEPGHFILNLFSKDRSDASGIGGLEVESTNERFSTTTTYAGRIWYSGVDDRNYSDKVYFSRVIRNENDLGTLYQEADPTSESFSDLVDTDGGELTISGAREIKYLYPYGADLLVFARNGIWQIAGIDRVFKPSAYAVIRLASVGIPSSSSVVDVDGTPIWWGFTGIYTITRDQVSGEGSLQNLSISTIQTFWDEIAEDKRYNSKGTYDSKNKRVYWIYGDSNESIDNKYNNILVFDTVLQSFFPWSISDKTSNTDYVTDLFYYDGSTVQESLDESVTVNGEDVIVSSVTVTVASTYNTGLSNPQVRLIVKTPNDKVTFATFTGNNFLDWGESEFSSYVIAGYDFLQGGITPKKNTLYVTTMLSITEDGFDESGDGYTLVDPSSCLMSSRWDFRSDFSTPRQIYRFKRPIIVEV